MFRKASAYKRFIGFFVVGFTLSGLGSTSHAAVFAMNGGTGFGGQIGSGSLDLTDNGTSLIGTFTKGAGFFSDALVIYFDTTTGGETSIGTSGDIGSDFYGRRAIANEFGSGVTFPATFDADFALVLAPREFNVGDQSQHLFSIPSSPNMSNLGFISTVGLTNIGDNDAASYSFSFALSDIGFDPFSGDSFDFVVTYLNPLDGGGNDATFRSDEGLGFVAGGNPGFGGLTFTTFATFTTSVAAPEPNTLGLVVIAAFMLRSIRRKKS